MSTTETKSVKILPESPASTISASKKEPKVANSAAKSLPKSKPATVGTLPENSPSPKVKSQQRSELQQRPAESINNNINTNENGNSSEQQKQSQKNLETQQQKQHHHHHYNLQAEEKDEEKEIAAPHRPSTAPSPRLGFASSPATARREYISELRVRQNSQLTSIASFLESHARVPFGALCGKNLGGWTYGPSYSRTVESLEPDAESFPPTSSSRRTVILSSARSLPFNVEQEVRRRASPPLGSTPRRRGHHRHHHHDEENGDDEDYNNNNAAVGHDQSPPMTSRPGTSRSANNANASARDSSSTARSYPTLDPASRSNNGKLIKTSFYNVILEAPFNVRPSTARFPSPSSASEALARSLPSTGRSANNAPREVSQRQQQLRQLQQQQQGSGRPLASEYFYPSRNRTLKNDELISKSDLAVEKHLKQQRRIELQKERLKDAAPMEFKWQL